MRGLAMLGLDDLLAVTRILLVKWKQKFFPL